jgi:hypothetical protein
MESGDLKGRLLNRYAALFSLLAIMLYIHLRIIPIHPLIFLVWPLSLWLSFEIFLRFKEKRLTILAFIATFVLYVIITQLLVVESFQGIFFDFEPVHNMSTMSYVVLAEAVLIFIYDAFITRSTSFGDVPAYVGFASVIPWLSPAIVEAIILTRWSLDGIFSILTVGKGIGGASLNDILFYYGGRNFVFSSLLFYASVLVLYISQRMMQRLENDRLKGLMDERDKEWLVNAWEHPLTLLSVEEREAFLVDHGHLGTEQQLEVLRNEILPAKGMFLIDPETLS